MIIPLWIKINILINTINLFFLIDSWCFVNLTIFLTFDGNFRNIENFLHFYLQIYKQKSPNVNDWSKSPTPITIKLVIEYVYVYSLEWF